MPQELFAFTTTAGRQVLCLRLPPNVDSEVFDDLNARLIEMARSAGPGWVVDLARVAYFRSALLGLLANLHIRIMKTGGRMVLANVPPTLVEAFEACCLERLFVIAKTPQEAAKMI